jgi:hypothetical protein
MTANPQNLISLADRTTDEQRRICAAGGRASGIARRANAEVIKKVEALLSGTLTVKGQKKKGSDIWAEALFVGVTEGLKKSNPALWREWMDRTEGKAAQPVELTGADGGAVKVEQSVDLSGVPLDDLIKAKALIYGGSNKGGDGSE